MTTWLREWQGYEYTRDMTTWLRESCQWRVDILTVFLLGYHKRHIEEVLAMDLQWPSWRCRRQLVDTADMHVWHLHKQVSARVDICSTSYDAVILHTEHCISCLNQLSKLFIYDTKWLFIPQSSHWSLNVQASSDVMCDRPVIVTSSLCKMRRPCNNFIKRHFNLYFVNNNTSHLVWLTRTESAQMAARSFLGAEVNHWPGMSQSAPLWPIHTWSP